MEVRIKENRQKRNRNGGMNKRKQMKNVISVNQIWQTWCIYIIQEEDNIFTKIRYHVSRGVNRDEYVRFFQFRY